MEEKEIMYFKDEEGNKVAFEAIARIYLEEQEYLILSPQGEDVNDDDAFVFRVDEIDGKQELNLVEDDEEFERVRKEYKKLLYN
ncbi:DUF1292 domain-containing protein [Inconstantimicrobium mannanitabidum]|uniref:Uncharacterized protein n=1 Tax=Inconstantimicrobium mannanitabidum TaxID=1604901 RepID=A0ACB5RC76_9CLOT|nr:DUF1292 domain-containing protein [Clostridium sp. TW13]GKX66855.1 hypothetical protein rsdtw13_21130 [Clostridium sp. TW13]